MPGWMQKLKAAYLVKQGHVTDPVLMDYRLAPCSAKLMTILRLLNVGAGTASPLHHAFALIYTYATQ
jgi:hypothetical protein